ncbi:reverse transcriptase domain-containing protein [Tanacetum coccineum]
MPFGLRNAEATYQRLVDKAFHKQIGRNLKVYVDDLVIKSRMNDEIVRDMEETFQTLREINMKLNPKKCTSGIEEGCYFSREIITILQNFEKINEEKRFLLDYGSGRSIQANEANHCQTSHVSRTIGKRGAYRLSGGSKRNEEESSDTLIGEEEELPEPWILCTDRSSCTDGSGAGLILTNPKGMEFTYALRFRFDATNNEAEYEALIAGLKIAEQMGVKNIKANVDSRLVANQVNGTYVAQETDMVRYLEKVKTLTSSFKAFLIKQVPRSENKKADAHAHWYTIRHGKSLADWLLLANHARGRKKADKGMPRLPSSQACSKESSAKAKPNHVSVAILKVGGLKQNQWRPSLATKSKNSYGITSSVDLDSQEKSSWIMENNSKKIRSRTGAKNYVSANTLLLLNTHKPMAHRTMIKSSNGDTTFSLTYGTEAVIPAEIGMPTLRTEKVDLIQNNEALEINLDLLEERREQATIREARSKAKMERYYNSKVRSTSFKPGDLVYRNNHASHAEDTGKLGPKWEGPYEVTEALGNSAYKLRDRDGKQLLRTWNISNLKKCYVHSM